MKIDRETIEHLEKLARIELTPDERGLLSKQLDRIVEYVEQLADLDTENISPTSVIVHQEHSTLREDVLEKGLDRKIILEQAPDSKDGFFRVPRILER